MPANTDLAVFFIEHRHPGKCVETLVELEVFPVRAPSLTADTHPLSLDALQDAVLIHEDDGEFWARWFSAVGAEQFATTRAVYVESTHAALALASADGGFAINDAFKGGLLLREGRLVKPFGAMLASQGRYVLMTYPQPRNNAAADAFEQWLRRQVASRRRFPPNARCSAFEVRAFAPNT